MDFSTVPITQFYDKCLKGARNSGFKWVVSLIAREADVRGLYQNLKKSWYSLDSITNKYFLFVFAGKQNNTFEDHWESRVVDESCDYIGVYNEYITFLKDTKEPLKTHIRYDWRTDNEKLLHNVSKNHTEAINELKTYFGLSESEIPCLVFTSLFSNRRMIVPIDNDYNDLYGYFKNLFCIIEPKLIMLDSIIESSVDLGKKEEEIVKTLKGVSFSKEETIVILQDELLEIARETKNAELSDCVHKKKYGTFKQPLRGQLSRYIDLVKNYEKNTGIIFDYENTMQKIHEKIKRKQYLENKLSQVMDDINNLKLEYLNCLDEIESIISSSGLKSSYKQKAKTESEVNVTINGDNIQIITAKDNSVVKVIQKIKRDYDQLSNLTSAVRKALLPLDDENNNDNKLIEESLDLIEEEAQKTKPYKKIIEHLLNTMKAIKGSVEFTAALAALIEFCGKYFGG